MPEQATLEVLLRDATQARNPTPPPLPEGFAGPTGGIPGAGMLPEWFTRPVVARDSAAGKQPEVLAVFDSQLFNVAQQQLAVDREIQKLAARTLLELERQTSAIATISHPGVAPQPAPGPTAPEPRNVPDYSLPASQQAPGQRTSDMDLARRLVAPSPPVVDKGTPPPALPPVPAKAMVIDGGTGTAIAKQGPQQVWSTAMDGGAGAAGTEAGAAMGGAAAAAVGVLAYAAADKLAQGIAAAIQQMSKAGTQFWQQTERLAANDALGMVTAASENAAGALDKIPIVGQIFAAELRAVTAQMNAMEKAGQAWVKRAAEIDRYSGAIIAAEVQANLRRMHLDMKEARTMGPDYARIIDARSQREAAERETMLPWKQFFAKQQATLEEGRTAIAQLAEMATTRVSQALTDALDGALSPITTSIRLIAAGVKKLAGKDDKSTEFSIEELEKSVANLPGFDWNMQPGPADNTPVLNPTFPGQ